VVREGFVGIEKLPTRLNSNEKSHVAKRWGNRLFQTPFHDTLVTTELDLT